MQEEGTSQPTYSAEQTAQDAVKLLTSVVDKAVVERCRALEQQLEENDLKHQEEIETLEKKHEKELAEHNLKFTNMMLDLQTVHEQQLAEARTEGAKDVVVPKHQKPIMEAALRLFEAMHIIQNNGKEINYKEPGIRESAAKALCAITRISFATCRKYVFEERGTHNNRITNKDCKNFNLLFATFGLALNL